MSRPKLVSALAASALTLVAACSAGSADVKAVTPTAYCHAPLKTVSHYLGVSTPEEPQSLGGVSAFADLIGRKPNLISYYTTFGENFNSKFVCAVLKYGALPLIQIDPWHTSVANIAAGDYDSYLTQYAAAAASLGGPVAVSFGHEMNGFWYPWGWKKLSPVIFVAAWRQIHNVFVAAGATNVIWVWTVNIALQGSVPLSRYYPGAAYVDWIGVDGYYRYTGETFYSLFGQTFAQISAISQKPLLIAETAVARGNPDAGTEVRGLFSGIDGQKDVLGFVWFNYPGPADKDWQLSDDSDAVSAFRQADRSGW